MRDFGSGILALLGLLTHRTFGNRLRFRSDSSRIVWIDVSRVSRGYNSGGISRATLRFSEELLRIASDDVRVGFFSFSNLGHILSASDWAIERFPRSEGRIRQGPVAFSNNDLIFSTELALPPRGLRAKSVRMLRSKGVGVFFFVYDLLPLRLPKLFPHGRKFLFSEWFEAVLEGTAIVSISNKTSSEIEEYLAAKRRCVEPRLLTLRLGSDFVEGDATTAHPKKILEIEHSVLMVGTLEPRKDYKLALETFELLWRRGLNFSVVIVGRKGWKSRREVKLISRLKKRGRPLTWLSQADDDELRVIYRSSTFLFANSIDEGLGLPVLEALRLGSNVVAQDIAIFRESAGDAIRFVDTRDPEILADQLEAYLSGSVGLEAPGRTLDLGETWTGFCLKVLAGLNMLDIAAEDEVDSRTQEDVLSSKNR